VFIEMSVDPRFVELRATGERAVRNALVEDFAWLAKYCAARFAHRGEPRDDLVQAALVGLVKAVDRFDPGRGVVFSTFAVPTIMGELRRHFRDKTWPVHVPRRGKDLYMAVGAVVDELTAALGRSPSVAEIAERADLTIEEALEALEMRSCYRGLPLEPEDQDAPRLTSRCRRSTAASSRRRPAVWCRRCCAPCRRIETGS
jgi:RNA polymerase sigma-B factor